jgi:hypothetical protein
MRGHLYIGVDPGASKTSARGGGLAVIDEAGRVVGTGRVPVMDYVVTTKTTKPKPKPEVDAREFYDMLCEIINRRPIGGELYAVIEEPPATPIKFGDDEGKKDKKAWRTPFDLTLKAHYGAIKALLRLLCGRDNIITAYPQTWKSAMEVTSDKQTSLDAARELFPEVDLRHKKQHNIAEALLLAHYGWQVDIMRRATAATEEAQR